MEICPKGRLHRINSVLQKNRPSISLRARNLNKPISWESQRGEIAIVVPFQFVCTTLHETRTVNV